MAESTRYVGVRRPRIDARDKVLGATRYGGDRVMPGLLHARIVPSVYAHAMVRGIDMQAALDVPGVVAVLTAADLPTTWHGPERRFEPLARHEVVFVGQPVALVVAETDAAAADAVNLVEVDLEPLEPVIDVIAASLPGAPMARVTPSVGDAEPHDGNVFHRLRERRGNVAAAFGRCEAVVGGRFHVPWAYQAAIEPQVATAWLEADGALSVTAAVQGTFFARNELAKLFGLPSSRVRVSASTIGGAFGAKQVVVEPLVAGAALRLRRPVRLVLERRDDLAAGAPAQGVVAEVRIGADGTGQLEALEARIVYDGGAFPEDSWQWFAPRLITGPYRWNAFEVEALGVRTNRFGAGNYRGPSGPQGVFALESLIDELAGSLGIDPIDFRAANLVTEGDLQANDTPWPPIGAIECLDRLRQNPAWGHRDRLPRGEGIGLAIGVWPGSMQPAAATCRLEPDGTLTVVTGAVDISGTASGFAIIAAEAFGIPVERITVITADTTTAPQSPPTNASSIIYASGRAVQEAAADARERLLAVAAGELEIDPEDLEIVEGVVRPKGSPQAGRTIGDLARDLSESFDAPWRPVEGHAAIAHTVVAPSAAAHLAHVRVDEETGQVELLSYVIAQDVGRALNPDLVEGQMQGGAAQSIGRALWEELVHDDRGQLLTGTFLDYAVPRATTLPPIETMIVEVPAPEGPFGAKGIGEAPILAGPAAIANAIAAATGVRLRELPMSPPRVWAALRARDATRAAEQSADGTREA
jgi:CO/xanthine dehydrogenase Mo-binding subunit